MTTDVLKNHILGVTNAKNLLHQTWALPVNQKATNLKVGVMVAAASVSDDIKTKLNNIHTATCDTQKDSVSTYGATVSSYKDSGTHTDDEWKKKINDANDAATKTVTDKFTSGKDKAIDLIKGLSTDDEKNAATDYYNRGLVYPVQLIDALVYEINTIVQSVADIILGVLKTVEAVGNTIETAAVSILAQILAL